MFSQKSNRGVVSTNQSRRPFPRPVKWLLVSSLLVSMTVATLAVSPNAIQKAHAAFSNLVWSDEFNGASNTGVDTSRWLYDTGTGYGCSGCGDHWGTGEIETMTNSTANVYQDGAGHLVIKAINNGGTWTSGRIESTSTSFAAPAGGIMAVEASIQQPTLEGDVASGYWPAFWMLGSAYRGNYLNWPNMGEIDILEDVNGQSSVISTLHCGTNPGGPCNETTGITSGLRACSGCQIAFHTYRVEVDRSVAPEQIRYYLDGVNFFTINANQVDAATWANTVDHSFFFILNLAIGGGLPAAFGYTSAASTRSGGAMLVDYIRVYTSPTPSSSSCSGTFTQGLVNSGSNSALPWFQPCGWTAGYVILHYSLPGQPQQDVTMTYNSSTTRWEYTVNGLSSSQALTYSFTYQRKELQYDTGSYP